MSRHSRARVRDLEIWIPGQPKLTDEINGLDPVDGGGNPMEMSDVSPNTRSFRTISIKGNGR